MRRCGLALVLASTAAGSAVANPLADALKADGGTACFVRSYDSAWLKAHPGQTVREVQLALTHDPGAPSSPAMRVMIRAAGAPLYLFGSCSWMAGDLNRGAMNNVLDPTFKPTTGVGCHMMTDVTGVSAEEGGDFPVAWGDGKWVQAHLPDAVAAWRGRDTRDHARFVKVARADRIVRLNRAKSSACGSLVAEFAPGQPR